MTVFTFYAGRRTLKRWKLQRLASFLVSEGILLEIKDINSLKAGSK
jgi:hypothetical protein